MKNLAAGEGETLFAQHLDLDNGKSSPVFGLAVEEVAVALVSPSIHEFKAFSTVSIAIAR
jgi:hypothetical protein